MKTRLELEFDWKLKGNDGCVPLRGLTILLEGIEQHGNLRAAAVACGMSYRHAWGTLRTAERNLGIPVVKLSRGRGSHLTKTGHRLLRAVNGVGESLDPQLAKAGESLSEALAGIQTPAHPEIFLIAASHGFGILHLRDRLQHAEKGSIELHHFGSLESLHRYDNGDCEAVGFHVPLGNSGKALAEKFTDILDPKKDRLLILEHREQGLLSRPEKACPNIRQLANRRLRFVNRQPGSGTRLLFDAQLAKHHIRPNEIYGYEHEEHTHLAVASLISGKVADAGFGIRQAAEQFALKFFPMVREIYFLAMKTEVLDGETGTAIRSVLLTPDYLRQFGSVNRGALAIGSVLEVSDVGPLIDKS